MFHPIDRVLTAPPLHSNSELSLIATLCLLFELTPAEGRLLLKLVKHDHVTREELHRGMSDGEPVTGSKIVDVTLGRVRRKLAPHNVTIATIRGLGFRMSENSRDEFRKRLGVFGADVVAAATPAAGNAPPRPRKAKSVAA